MEKRQRIEKEIVRQVVESLTAAGFKLNIDVDGDYTLLIPTNDVEKLVGAMFQTDEERLYVFREGQKNPFGWVFFVYGNDGWDVIADFTVNVEDYLTDAMTMADNFQNEP